MAKHEATAIIRTKQITIKLAGFVASSVGLIYPFPARACKIFPISDIFLWEGKNELNVVIVDTISLSENTSRIAITRA